MDSKWIAYHENELKERRAAKLKLAMLEILDCLLASPGITEPNIISIVRQKTGLRPIPVATGLSFLLHKEYIHRNGKGRRGSPFLYYFP